MLRPAQRLRFLVLFGLSLGLGLRHGRHDLRAAGSFVELRCRIARATLPLLPHPPSLLRRHRHLDGPHRLRRLPCLLSVCARFRLRLLHGALLGLRRRELGACRRDAMLLRRGRLVGSLRRLLQCR